ncbi:MAG TPA: hypothetical protein VF188_00100 [Longimicrobiales bacterium]
MGTLAPVFASMYRDADTADPFRRAQALGRADDLGRTLGAGPEFETQQRQDEQDRLRAITAEHADEADLASGRPERIAMLRAALNNRVADVNSEAAAGRSFLPFAEQRRAQDMADAIQRAETQYGYPAQIKAQADLEGHRIDAAAREHAAQMQYEPTLGRILGQRFAGGNNITDTESWLRRLLRGDNTNSQAIEMLRQLLKPGEIVNIVGHPRGY